jgi:hypothetical protein
MIQKDLRHVAKLLQEAILQAIRGLLPVKSILREYLHDDDEDAPEKEEKEDKEEKEEKADASPPEAAETSQSATESVPISGFSSESEIPAADTAATATTTTDEETPAPPSTGEIPNVDEHIKNLMKGKLGKLAMEFAEETARDMEIDIENATDTNDAFQKMFKNPSNLMNVVKNVGEKLDNKIKSGEIKESEILAEGMDLLNNMKNIPGMENMQSMFAAMGLGGGGQKMNQGATNSRLQQNLKMAQMRERMRKKQQEQQQQQQTQQQQQQAQPQVQPQEVPFLDVGISSENKKKKKNKSKK